MDSLKSKYYSDLDLCNYDISDLKNYKIGVSRQEDAYVKAKVGDRNTPIYDNSVCRVTDKIKDDPLIENKIEPLNIKEIKEKMPRRANERYAVPSIKGEYIEVVECRNVKYDKDGNASISTGRSSIIPIEYVKDIFNYDQAILEIDSYD